MTDLTYYNDDPRYQLMATIIESSNVFGGDTEMFKDDYIAILKLCYTFTIDHKWTAQDLAEQIVSYLLSQWGITAGFEEFAREFWTPSAANEAPGDPGPEPSENPSDQDQLLIP